ncbi:peptide ABC transporter substrate-binding protein [Candidatus Saccharibacteria bacterium]|nr:peptide ABC transporter substrate-binding protein [Candidatus Saccharibacteria bacterium]
MIDRTTKLRWRRRFRRSKKQVEEFGSQTDDNLEKHFFGRLSKLAKVRRFVASWIILLGLLVGGVFYQARALGQYYLQPTPTPGGIFTEGVVGTFTNISPLYATGNVDGSVERLVFSGLLKFDQNNKLVGDLAQGWSVDETGKIYTVTLKDDIFWHDGQTLTTEDVVFTYKMIQNPDAKSPLASSWQGIKVSASDESTVVFTLPSILSAFPYSLTNGIVPKHVLDNTPPSQLRSSPFNTRNPIGSGPYKWEAVEVTTVNEDAREQRIALVPNPLYKDGAPKIDRFIMRSFSSEERLSKALINREVNAAAGLSTLPEPLKNDLSTKSYNVPLTSEVMTFYKTTSEMFNDVKVRQALTLGIDVGSILVDLGRPVLPAYGPLLKGQIGYDPAIKQQTNDKVQAAKLLDEAGWTVKKNDNKRYKDNQQLTFTLTTQDNPTYRHVADELKKQWYDLGVVVTVVPLREADLQSALVGHTYDALLYGISLGADPDVFAYWHSSQASLQSASRLNFSEYQSIASDTALEGGRTRSEDYVRTAKYKPFLEAWQQDVPALALYQPRYLYVVRDVLDGFSPTSMNSGADRFNNVQNWMIRITNQPIKD